MICQPVNLKFSKMNNYMLIPALIITGVTAGCSGNKSRSDNNEAPVQVLSAKVVSVDQENVISVSGNIEGSKTVCLGFMVAGKVNFIAANEGDIIKKGQLLSSLDPSGYSIAKELADIQVSQVQDEYNRLKMMHDSNSLSESDFARISYGLQQARVQQKLHSKNLEDTKLHSPMDGVLLKKLCEEGEITGTGLPLFVVSDIRKIKVSAFIPENELHKIKIGQSATVTVSSVDRTFEGKITEVGSAADPASRAFVVKIEVENPKMLMRPGMIAEISIRSSGTEKILAIPAESVLHDFNGQSYVYVIDTTSNKVFRRDISSGRLLNDRIEIISGLDKNEIIVTGGQYRLTEGASVSTNN